MEFTNSSLVEYTLLSPNNSGQRAQAIDRITPHCVVGQCTAEGLGEWFYAESTHASSNYGIDKNGRVGLYVEEKNRSWCSSSSANDQRAITIECASDKTQPYAMYEVVYEKLILLCADICKRYGKKRLLWFEDKEKTLAYKPKSDEIIITVHRWFANKSCPGDWLYERLADLAEKVTRLLQNSAGMQATEFSGLSEKEVIAKVGPLFTTDQKKSGILASVSLAQFILESGYGKSDLAQNANNCFGMKKSLSGNTWEGSAWDGKSFYTMQTKEQNKDGSYETIVADFRKYSCVEDSIADHSAYLLGAMKGKEKRYKGIAGMKDYKAVVQLIKDGGYATDLAYVEKLCKLIERWNLTQFDVPEEEKWYRVRKAWEDSKSQKGAFKILANARKCADENAGYSVYDYEGKVVYSSAAFVPYLVKVRITDLNIRKGPGTNYARVQYIPIGIYTIVEEADGNGATKWGKLKSGIGWISLDYVTKV